MQLSVDGEVHFQLDVRVRLGDLEGVEVSCRRPVQQRALPGAVDGNVGDECRRVDRDRVIVEVVTDVRVVPKSPAFVFEVVSTTERIVRFDLVDDQWAVAATVVKRFGEAMSLIVTTGFGHV